MGRKESNQINKQKQMYPDQTAPVGAVCSGFIVFASSVKVFATDIIAERSGSVGRALDWGLKGC